ncbi:MAG: WD40 repeat domain-containing protein [Verrucomicrobia bacterium]|nr:WD40 repeat domain-containing protein [Verrucomicrobiota bacterium]
MFRLQTLLLPALLLALGGWAEVVTRPVRSFGLGEVQQLAVSPDGRHLATAGPAGAFLWDRAAGTVQHRFEEHGWRVSAIAFSPDGQVLVTASDDRLIRAWDVESGTARGTFAGHRGEILGLAFAPDGRSFASASADNTARIWALESGELLQTVEVRGAFIDVAVFTPEGDRLITAATAPADRIRLWDLASGKTIRTFDTPAWQVPALGFVRGGYLVSAGDDLQVRVWNLETGEFVRALSGATLAMADLIASPDLPTVTVGCSDGRVIQWDAETGEVRHEFTGPLLVALGEIPGAGRVMTAGPDNLLREWDLETGVNLRTLSGHSTSVTLGVAFSPDGSQVLSGGGEAAVRLWDRATGELVRTFQGHGGGTATVGFMADGSRVLTTRGAPQPMAQLWNAQTGELVRDFSWPTGWPMCAVLSADGGNSSPGRRTGASGSGMWRPARSSRISRARPAG